MMMLILIMLLMMLMLVLMENTKPASEEFSNAPHDSPTDRDTGRFEIREKSSETLEIQTLKS